jgi:outer membrane usher protein FimD/PapC
MQLFIQIRKQFWPLFIRVIFYSLCFAIFYKISHLTPKRPLPRPIIIVNKPKPLSPPSHPHPTSTIEENYYEVTINEQKTNQIVLFLAEKGNNIWIPAKSLADWRLLFPQTAPAFYGNEKYYNVKNFPGLTYQIDPVNMTIKLSGPSHLFEANTFSGNGSSTQKFTPPSPGLFINYNFFETRNRNSSLKNQYNDLFTIGLFTPYGVGTNTFEVQNTPNARSLLRLT